MKRCGKCHAELPPSEFQKRSRGGYRSECKTCRAAYNAAWYAAHREEIATYSAEYRAAHREKIAASRGAYYAANSEGLKAYQIKRKYGMTGANRAEMFARQGGLCACDGCDNPATHIDHCHDCESVDRRGSVRGLLCHPCNANLDHIARFSPAHAAYLAAHAAVCPAIAV